MAKNRNRNRNSAPRQNADVENAARDIAPDAYDKRICVPAPMPVQCPRCRSSRTTAANGVHYNLHFGVRYEHRVCGSCRYTFTASRRMTAEELEEKAGTGR